MALANNKNTIKLLLVALCISLVDFVQGQVPPVPRSICFDNGYTNAQAEEFCKDAYGPLELEDCVVSEALDQPDIVYNKECVMLCDDQPSICEDYGMTCYSDLGCLIPHTTTYEGATRR